jgi:hypothetical protein
MNNCCNCLFFHAHINEMHSSRSKIPSKNLVRQRCAEGFNSGVKGLNQPMVLQSLHIYCHRLFNSFELYLPKNKVNCVRHCKLYLYGVFISAPVCLVTRACDLCWLQARILCQTIKQTYLIGVMTESFRGCFCLQGHIVSIRSQPLAKSRPNPSARQIPSYT